MAVPIQEWRGLYAIVDPDHPGRYGTEDLAERILDGGCGALQLRAKHLADRQTLKLGERLRARCDRAGVPFVLNDRPDLAALLDADGVHLGQEDVPVGAARILWPDRCLGVSTHDVAQARAAVREGADLVGFGPVFFTGTKASADPVVGVTGLAAVCAAVPVPVVAIGGIGTEHLEALAAAGARMIAAISALAQADDVAAVARSLHEVVP